MQTKWFRPSANAVPAPPMNVLPHAEHALMAEALLRATSSLLERLDPTAVVTTKAAIS